VDVTLTPVAYEDKPILARLLELYSHDMSEFYEDVRINQHGLFLYRHLDHYWTEEGRYPYLIRVDDRIAGFVLVREVEAVFQIAEFFVLRNLRRTGVGAVAASAAFHKHPGRWEVWHAASNKPAAAFWGAVVPAAAVRADEGSEVVYRFEVPLTT
jgi:predicted acetyltransferase